VHHNEVDGLIAHDRAVVDLHGTKTDIHSNKRGGIHADDRAKVNHSFVMPSEHNASHDNVGVGGDRNHSYGGTIANINADGTFTHVVVQVEEDDNN